MSVTIGEHEYTLDPKNRLVVPPRYREALAAEKGSDFILTEGTDGCIGLFLPSQWEKFLVKFESKSFPDARKARAYRRRLYGSAEPARLDEQGRILVPEKLKRLAKLRKGVVIVGAGNKAEIWDRDRWRAYAKETGSAYEELAQDLDL